MIHINEGVIVAGNPFIKSVSLIFSPVAGIPTSHGRY